MLFELNTLWSPWDIVLQGVLIPHREGERVGEHFANYGTGTTETKDLKFSLHIGG